MCWAKSAMKTRQRPDRRRIFREIPLQLGHVPAPRPLFREQETRLHPRRVFRYPEHDVSPRRCRFHGLAEGTMAVVTVFAAVATVQRDGPRLTV